MKKENQLMSSLNHIPPHPALHATFPLMGKGNSLYLEGEGRVRSTGVRGQSRFGFTLIELLVVVLIIGILAAIAVPQYQMTVAKARFTQLQILGNGLKKAVQLYFLANGEYTQDFTQLDLEMPGTIWPDKRHVYLGKKSCGFTLYESEQDGEMWCAYDSNKDWGEKGTVPLWGTNFRPHRPIVCRAYSALQNKLCRSFAVNPVECTPSGNGTYCQYVIVSSF